MDCRGGLHRLRVCRSKKLSLSVVEDFSYDSQEIMSRLALYDYDAAIHRFEPFLEKVFASTIVDSRNGIGDNL